MGYVAYKSCPASEVPAGLTWGAEDRWPAWPLVKEYAWNPGDAAGDLRVFIPGAPWMRTTDTTLPEGNSRRVTWFRLVPCTDLDANP